MIKNIIFDLGNVILKDYPNIVLDQVKIDKEQYESIKSNFFSDWKALDLGLSTLKEHLEKCKFNFKITPEVEALMLCYYKYRPFNDEVLELIKLLKEKQYKLYILSNNNKEAEKYLTGLPIFKNFDGWVFSCDYQLKKPDPKLYNILFETCNLKPEECFFIDDKQTNIEIGKKLGMNGFVLDYKNDGTNALIKQLKIEKIL